MKNKILSLRPEPDSGGGVAAKVAELRKSIYVGVNQFDVPVSFARSVTRDELKAVVGQVEQLIQLDIKEIEWGLENVYKMVTLPPFDEATVQDRVSIFRELTMFCENICGKKGYLLGKALAKHYFGYNFRNISLISDAGRYFSEAAYIYLELDRARDAQRCFFVAGEIFERISNSEMKTSRAYMRAHGLSLELNERFLIIDAYAASKKAITSFVNQQDKYSMANILNFCVEMIEIGNKLLDLNQLEPAQFYFDTAKKLAEIWSYDSGITNTSKIVALTVLVKSYCGLADASKGSKSIEDAPTYYDSAHLIDVAILELSPDYPFSEEDKQIMAALGINRP